MGPETSERRGPRICALALCVVLVALVVPGALRASSDTAPPVVAEELRAPPEAAGASVPAPAKSLPAADREMRRIFARQYAVSEDSGDARSRAWALLIGINDYAGRTADAIGSRQDAEALKRHLVSLGWRSDHIMLITDRRATARNMLSGIRWLASKTTTRSTVIFHYAGHEMPRYNDPDGDGEYRDVEFWGADNRYLIDETIGRELGRVRAARMWIHLATCRAAGFDDPGMSRKGRIITYSSVESELSYEDPDKRHSVMGYYMIVAGMVKKAGDANRDRRVAVEEAYRWARPHILRRTGDRQHPTLSDRAEGWFYIDFPRAKRPPSGGSQPPPSGSDDDSDGPVCISPVYCP